MKSISEISRNLEAVEQTRHITNAMYMLSVTAMRRGMTQIDYNCRYMQYVCTAVKDILEKSPDVRNAFVHGDDYVGKNDTALFVIASDKSLCGAYNQNIAAMVQQQIRRVTVDGRQVLLYTAGDKIAEILHNRGFAIEREFEGASQMPSMYHAYEMAQEAIELYREGYAQDVYVIFTDYVTVAERVVRCRRLLPLAVENFDPVVDTLPLSYPGRMMYEPSVEAAYAQMVPTYLQGYLYGCLCNALVSENLARMEAMQSATHNADEMLKALDIAYNTARQQIITDELTEIAAAAELINKSI